MEALSGQVGTTSHFLPVLLVSSQGKLDEALLQDLRSLSMLFVHA
jgi:hypothetical protein